MKHHPALAGAWLIVATSSAGPSANAKTFARPGGRAITLPDLAGIVGQPAISPDGHEVAYNRAVGPTPQDPGDPQPTEVVVIELPNGTPKTLVSPSSSYFDLRSAVRVTYGTDESRLYVEATCPCDSHSIHEIDSASGSHRLIAWGIGLIVLRDGPWKGDLLLGIHTCYRSHPGCDYPVNVVTRAGKTIYVVPRTSGADGAARLQSWLKSHGWRAS